MNEEGSPPSGLREKIRRGQGGSEEPLGEPEEGSEGTQGAQRMENEAEEEGPREQAVQALLQGETDVQKISHVTGLSPQTIHGLRGWLIRSGQLQGKEPQKEESPRRAEGKPDPLADMREEMSRTLEEELMSVPGASEKASAYILKRFASDEELLFDAYRLHALIARFNPRLSDADVMDIVQRVQRVAESYHLDRMRGMGTFQGYRVGLPRAQGFPDYDQRAGLMPGYGQQSLRSYSESDVATERRFWLLESRVEKIDSGLESINKGLEEMNGKLDEKKSPIEDESVKALGQKIEKLEHELKSKDRELDEKDKQHLKEELGELKEEIKGLRSNLGEWRTDEYKLIGEGFGKLTEFGREVLKEAPLSKAAQNVASAMMPQGNREVPPEARKTVLDSLREAGYVVAE